MFWFAERHRQDTGLFFGARRVYSYHSSFQEIEVLESHSWGRMLVLDGLVQMTDRDEYYYHEMLVHVPLHLHPEPRRILIIGGGDGGTLREVLKHPVEHVILCEIDPEVIQVVRRHWPEIIPVFEDRRVEIVCRDGRQYITETDERPDVIIVDSSDPVSHSRALFSRAFLQDARRVLSDHGIFVTQSLSPFWSTRFLVELYRKMTTVFGSTGIYLSPVPTYPSGWWSFSIATPEEGNDFTTLQRGPVAESTRVYNSAIHRAAFALPEFLRQELDR